MNNDQNNNQANSQNGITTFATNVAKAIKNLHIGIIGLATLAIGALVLSLTIASNVDSGNKLYREMNKQLNSEIKELKKQVKADSLDRVTIFKQIDSLHAERLKYDQSLERIDNKINSIKTGYDKIPAKYINVTIDSLNNLRTRFGQ